MRRIFYLPILLSITLTAHALAQDSSIFLKGELAPNVHHTGDVVKCEPGVEHWHAATPETPVTYLAITGNEPTVWLERVSEEEFDNITRPSVIDTSAEQELIDLSRKKWQWMADKDVDKLEPLFHEKSKFVHMGGTWGKDAELAIIESGRIWYKEADVPDVVVEVFDDTAIL